MEHTQKLSELAKHIRFNILDMTTRAKSGHPSSSLSAVELMTVLFFDGFLRYDPAHPNNPNNDRVLFSKGHASPLFYALYEVAGVIPQKELKKFRTLGSRLEGHPSMKFPHTEAPTGSLGQGLSVGVGLALHGSYVNKLRYKTYVLLGDSEMAEGQIWEAAEIATQYKLCNLIGILDMNRLGQSGPTMDGRNAKKYERKLKAFGWETTICNGHNIRDIQRAFKKATRARAPFMIIANTIKGKGVSFIEDKEGWHGKPLTLEQKNIAVKALGNINLSAHGKITTPHLVKKKKLRHGPVGKIDYQQGDKIAPRVAYGNALIRLYPKYPELIVLDAEVSNSTKTDSFKKRYPRTYFEMYIAEQNMVSVGLGMARQGSIPVINSFASFLTRAHDQIRMSQYAKQHIIYVGSHAGTSIGHDGPSQMGLADLSFFRSLFNSTVLYPSDAVSAEKCTELALKQKGVVYIRNTRMKLPVLYANTEKFEVGGSKTLRTHKKDIATIFVAGVTVHEALLAHQQLLKERLYVRVIDLYSLKPIDNKTIRKAAKETKLLLTVEDHVAEGGLSDAVRSVFSHNTPDMYSLAVTKSPQSAQPHELLAYESIDSSAIIRTVKRLIKK